MRRPLGSRDETIRARARLTSPTPSMNDSSADRRKESRHWHQLVQQTKTLEPIRTAVVHPVDTVGSNERFLGRKAPARTNQKINGCYSFTPLARYPPSTASRVPVTKLAASDARKIAAPISSSNSPKRFIGVRASISCPRGVPITNFSLNGVRK